MAAPDDVVDPFLLQLLLRLADVARQHALAEYPFRERPGNDNVLQRPCQIACRRTRHHAGPLERGDHSAHARYDHGRPQN